MDLSLTAEQRHIASSVRAIVERHVATAPGDAFPPRLDRPLMTALAKDGFLDVYGSGGSLLDATLVIDEVAAAGATVPIGARVLVGPLVADQPLHPIVGLADTRGPTPVRFGAEAEAFLVVAGEEAVLARRNDVVAEKVKAQWGYPVAQVTVTGGEPVGKAHALLRAWRIALSAEAGGLMRTAVLRAARYVTEREQFGRPIGSYQSIQHRLARGWVFAEGTRWLARRAAGRSGDDVLAAAAACYACEGMRDVLRSTHQVVGAIGITDEFGLTRITGKLAYLHNELGGAGGNARALARSRWLTAGAGASR